MGSLRVGHDSVTNTSEITYLHSIQYIFPVYFRMCGELADRIVFKAGTDNGTPGSPVLCSKNLQSYQLRTPLVLRASWQSRGGSGEERKDLAARALGGSSASLPPSWLSPSPSAARTPVSSVKRSEETSAYLAD